MAQPKTFSVQFPRDKRLATLRGHILRFKACVPMAVTEAVYRQAIAEGGIDGSVKISVDEPVPVSEPDPEPENDPDTTEQIHQDSELGIGEVEGTGTQTPLLAIARVMREIIDEANPDLLTGEGQPKAAEVNKRFGQETTREQRDEARKLLDEGIV